MPEEIVAEIQAAFQANETAWQEKLQQAETAHTLERENWILEQGIFAAGGKNAKAITALLDTGAIFRQENPQEALKAELTKLKGECGYLFDAPIVPQFSALAGTAHRELPQPATLAGAIRARMKMRKDD